MRYIFKHRFPCRYRRTAGKKRVRTRRIALLLGALLSLWTFLSEWGLSSISEELTKEAAKGYLLSCINRAVDEELGDGENSFVSVSRDGSGQISAVSANTGELNRIKAGVVSRLSKAINGRATAYVPIGSLTSVGIFNGRGPNVPVKLKLEGSADVSFHTEFTSAGVNQSCHRITMTVTVRAYSQSKRFEALAEADTATVLAETVVVGQVPDAVLAAS